MTTVDPALTERLDGLAHRLRSHDRVLVAFSGGVDSGYLGWLAARTLGPDRVALVTAVSPSLAATELDDCRSLAAEWGVEHIEVHTTEMENAAYRQNDLDRCFWCKDALMDAVSPIATARDATVLLGVNLDDLTDHRPGQQAAAARGARFPFVDAGLAKADVRAGAQLAGLRIWDKPAAPCLASRLPYGTEVTIGRLRSVETAEAALRELGFREVRVRHHGELARVEVPVADLDRLLGARVRVVESVRAAGYRWVTLDLDGLRSGNLNPEKRPGA